MARPYFKILLSSAFAASVLISGCNSNSVADKADTGWQKIGDLDGAIIFVEANPSMMRSAKQYAEAAKTVCGIGCIQVAFFEPGQLVPPSGSRSNFFDNGGWKGYDPIALKFGDDFTVWNCDKLNFPDAPESALCGKNTHEAHGAVLSIAIRDGWTIGCELPAYGGFSIVKEYSESLKEAQRKHILDAYRQMYESFRTGPDDPEFCETGRQVIEEKAGAAIKTLKSFTKL